MNYEKQQPSNCTKEVDSPMTGQSLDTQMGSENRKLIAEYQRMDEDNRVGVPVKKYTD